MKYYVEENVSQRSCTTIRHVVKMLGTISETLIFFFLGVVTITTEHEWNWGYILFTLLFAFVWRGLGTMGSGGSSVWVGVLWFEWFRVIEVTSCLRQASWC